MDSLLPLEPGWPREGVFARYLENPCLCAMTAEVDVTPAVDFARSRGVSFYGIMTWVVSYIVNNREEFRMGLTDTGEAGLWNVVHPVHNVFHPETETYTTLFTLWDRDPAVFLPRLQEDIARAAALQIPVIPSPPNTFEISSIPWIHYTNLSVQMADIPLSPMIFWGRYQSAGDRTLLPVTLQIHHAAADGFHIARFFEETQILIHAVWQKLAHL